jgi:hypothetical protein
MGKYGGHTPLGVELNKIDSKINQSDIERFKTARAILRESCKGLYVFTMDLLDGDGKVVRRTGPIPIIGTNDQLAATYGSPANMVGSDSEPWEAIIFYTGPTVNNGVALITRKVYQIAGGSFEAVTFSNELVAKGTAYAPPGSGM